MNMYKTRFLLLTAALLLALISCSDGNNDQQEADTSGQGTSVYSSIEDQIVAERDACINNRNSINSAHFTNAEGYTYHSGTCNGKTFGTSNSTLNYIMTNNTIHSFDASYIYKHFTKEYQDILKEFMYFQAEGSTTFVRNENGSRPYGLTNYNADKFICVGERTTGWMQETKLTGSEKYLIHEMAHAISERGSDHNQVWGDNVYILLCQLYPDNLTLATTLYNNIAKDYSTVTSK